MNRTQKSAMKGNGNTVDMLLKIFVDQTGQLRCEWKNGIPLTEVRKMLRTFGDIVSDMIVDAKILGKEDKPEVKRIIAPFPGTIKRQ